MFRFWCFLTMRRAGRQRSAGDKKSGVRGPPGSEGRLTPQWGKLFSGVDLTLLGLRCDSHPPVWLTCPKYTPQERSARFLIIGWCEAQHSVSSSTLILPGTSVAENADLSTRLDETHGFDS